MTVVQSEFEERAVRIPAHGLGLSVDVYSPPLVELDEYLGQQGVTADYLEVFHAAPDALASVSRRLPGRTFGYHGEGLWITQPEFLAEPHADLHIQEVCAQLRILRSAWLNIECASKQMAGAMFGTYLPPLYTQLSAWVVADNAGQLQRHLDREFRLPTPPLLLLEMPPLTYFAYGTLPIGDFFREITNRTACGLVLDIGHLWTVYRYTGAWRQKSVEQFVEGFLSRFPLERVVEIHVAGLAPHPCETAGDQECDRGVPRWIDAHGAPIPAVLFDMLELVLHSPRLIHLKGVALEVDTKDSAVIATELAAFRRRFGPALAGRTQPSASPDPLRESDDRGEENTEARLSDGARAALSRDYERYARLVTGQGGPDEVRHLAGGSDGEEGLNRYRRIYLPHELLHWGGDLADMFPRTCRVLFEKQLDVTEFVRFWIGQPPVASAPYDFFLLKVERFVRFIAGMLPEATDLVSQEAAELREAYHQANQHAGLAEVAG